MPGCLFLTVPIVNELLRVIVNDQVRDVPSGASVADLLKELGLHPKFLAVELNRRVVPRSEHSMTRLANGDQVEVVTLVGGG